MTFHNSPFAAHIRSLSLAQIQEVEAEMALVKIVRSAGVDWDWVKGYVDGTYSLEASPFEHQFPKGALELDI